MVGSQLYVVQNAARPWSLNLRGDPPCRFRFEVRAGDRWLGEAQAAAVERSELGGPGDATDPAVYGQPVWTAYQFNIEEGPANQAKWIVLGDWHVRIDPGDTAVMVSPWELELLPGEILTFDMHTTAQKPVTAFVPGHYLWKSLAPISRGRWHSVVSVAQFDWRPNGQGRVAVWLDGSKIVDYRSSSTTQTSKPREAL